MPGGQYLNTLDLTGEERRTLAALGATTPLALAHMIRTDRTSFRRLVGDRADTIEQSVLGLLSPEERARLDEAPPRFALGAQLGRPPTLPPPPFDLAQRDALFQELQSLGDKAAADPASRARIEEIERELNALLDSRDGKTPSSPSR